MHPNLNKIMSDHLHGIRENEEQLAVLCSGSSIPHSSVAEFHGNALRPAVDTFPFISQVREAYFGARDSAESLDFPREG